jgi:hypothetical protein
LLDEVPRPESACPMEDFEWDKNKNRANVEKHGIDFGDAIFIFAASPVEVVDDRFEYGEERIIAVGEVDNRVIVVVYTMRGDVCRIISARKANRDERTAYYTALAARGPRQQN